MKRGRFAWLPLCAFMAACGGGNDKGDDTGAGGGGGSGAAGGDTYTVKIGPITADAYEERTQCVVKSLGNAEPIHVGRFDDAISSSSHHMIVYRTNDTVEQAKPFDCEPFVETLDPSKGAPIMITQKHTDSLEFPDGVGYTLSANQMIRLELHYINPSAKAVTVDASATVTVIPDENYKNEADFLFIGSPDISIPAKSTGTVGPAYFPVPAEFDGSNFFAITGHTHRYGTDVKVWTSESETGPATPVYDVPGWLWNEPETVKHDPPFQVPANGGYTFQCDYENTGDTAVSFGESATKEMCFFWAYYYPSKGARVCFHTSKYSNGTTMNICCPGHFACQYILGAGF